jgi:bifunctional non-homologous end joining protein LigD
VPLDEYRRKRDFARTPEPSGGDGDGRERPPSAGPAAAFAGWDALPHGRRFCVQMHRATRLHFDLRLEHAGVLLSWAVPRGPSLDPARKRLAVHVEDHPIEYGEFEGVIPEGYGAGTVMLWDAGVFRWTGQAAEDADAALGKGHIRFVLEGSKLHGEFDLFRTGRVGGADGGDAARNWLLVKRADGAVEPGMEAVALDVSVKTGRSLAAIAADAGGDRKHPELAVAAARESVEPLLAGAPPAPFPEAPEVMLATPLDRPFSRPGWLFELKYDGVRTLASVRHGKLLLRSRKGRDETARYPEARALVDAMSVGDAVVDGEIVALDAEGRPSFQRLQSRINLGSDDVERARRRVPVTLVAFDVLYASGRDLRGLPLERRKLILRAMIHPSPGVLVADHVETEGEALFAMLRDQGLEGMVGKRADSRYESGRRSAAWVKVKAWNTQDCVICGYTAGRKGRGPLGALVLGVFDQDAVLRHAGQVGSGFDESTLRRLREQLDAITTGKSPLHPAPATDQAVTWVRPELVCEVRYSEWTAAGTLRQSSFRGLRTDVSPEDCVRARPAAAGEAVEVASVAGGATGYRTPPELEEALRQLPSVGPGGWWEVAGRRVKLTNPDKLLWPEDGITKRDMVAHYVRLAPLILPYLRQRPLSTQVFPDGIHGKSFWRKDKPSHAPEWINAWTYSGEEGVKTYIVAEEPATLAWLANAGVIDLHPWHSRIDAPDQPDWAVFDLDPFEPATFDDVRDVARMVKTALDHYQLVSVLKTSGQTGLQIYVPLRRGPDYAAVRGWVEDVARAIGKLMPDRISWEWTVSRRSGRIRIDYTQNIINKTLTAPYTLRPVTRAPVSTPIRWEELDDPQLRPDRWTIATIGERVAEVGDLFAPLLTVEQDLP